MQNVGFPTQSSNEFIAMPLSPEEAQNRKKVPVKGGQMAFLQLERGKFDTNEKISPDEVMKHNTEDDAWTVLNGKVYDITMYMEYHPGGIEKLMLGAGKDCSLLFNQFHPWLNGHGLLEKDFMGPLGPKQPLKK